MPADTPYTQLTPAEILNVIGDQAHDATEYQVAGVKVVGARGAAVAAPTGGATEDAEARTAIVALVARLVAHGLIAEEV